LNTPRLAAAESKHIMEGWVKSSIKNIM
jgi:hypothetical protein